MPGVGLVRRLQRPALPTGLRFRDPDPAPPSPPVVFDGCHRRTGSRLFAQHPIDQRRQLGRNLRCSLLKRLRWLIDVLRHHLGGARRAKRRCPSQHLVHDDAQGIDIGAIVDASGSTTLLRGHVRRRAHQHARPRHHPARLSRPHRQLRNAKIENLDPLSPPAAPLSGTTMMFSGFRSRWTILLVHDGQRRRRLHADELHGSFGQAAAGVKQPLVQAHPVEVFHREVRDTVGRHAAFENVDDTGMRDEVGGFGFVEKRLRTSLFCTNVW